VLKKVEELAIDPKFQEFQVPECHQLTMFKVHEIFLLIQMK